MGESGKVRTAPGQIGSLDAFSEGKTRFFRVLCRLSLSKLVK